MPASRADGAARGGCAVWWALERAMRALTERGIDLAVVAGVEKTEALALESPWWGSGERVWGVGRAAGAASGGRFRRCEMWRKE